MIQLTIIAKKNQTIEKTKAKEKSGSFFRFDYF